MLSQTVGGLVSLQTLTFPVNMLQLSDGESLSSPQQPAETRLLTVTEYIYTVTGSYLFLLQIKVNVAPHVRNLMESDGV